MKKSLFLFFALAGTVVACQPQENEAENIQKEAIKIHDDIMPLISVFDKNTVIIDSLISHLPAVKAGQPDLDTATYKTQLIALKSDLEGATDHMMEWMRDYSADSLDVNYQKAELQKVKDMKTIFDQVSADSKEKLNTK